MKTKAWVAGFVRVARPGLRWVLARTFVDGAWFIFIAGKGAH